MCVCVCISSVCVVGGRTRDKAVDPTTQFEAARVSLGRCKSRKNWLQWDVAEQTTLRLQDILDPEMAKQSKYIC